MRPSLFQLRALLPLLLVGIALAALLAAVWNDESARHARHANNLIKLQELDARLDRDLLQVASFMLIQYDPMVETVRQLNRIEQRIMSPETRFYDATDSAVKQAFKRYWEALQQKLEIAERVKSQAAVVRNGLHYLPVAVDGLQDGDPEIYEEVLRLLNRLLRFNLFNSQSDLDDIHQDLDALELLTDLPRENRGVLNNILFHMRANLNGLQRLNDLESAYLAIPSSSHFKTLNQVHEAYRHQAFVWIQRLKLGLSLLVLGLILGLWLTMRRWDAARRASEQSWGRLHDAVESIAEAFALFDDQGRLILHNRRYLAFYPWLRHLLNRSTSLEEVQRMNDNHLQQRPVAETEADPGVSEQIRLEQVEDGRWYLASDSRTSEGGTVLVRTDITRTKQTEEALRKLSRALEQSPVSVVITDTQGIIEYVNPKFEAISGYRAEQALGQNPRILKSDEMSSDEYREMWETLKSGREWRGHFHNRRPDGSMYWESASISPLRNEQGEITHYIAVKEDITARRRTEEQLRLHAAVFETTNEGIMVVGRDGHIKAVNPAFSRITGYPAQEATGQSCEILSSGRHDSDFFRRMWESIDRDGYWSGEIWERRKDGRIFPAWLSIAAIRSDQDGISDYVSVFSDITQRKRDEQQILYQATFDTLTRLPNRTLLFDRLTQAIASARREGWKLGLMFVDLDHFKGVNDTFGHVTGDQLLKHVARRLQGAVRESDTIARFGGDEFVILLQDIGQAGDAALVAESVIRSLAIPFELDQREVYTGASIGITLFPDDADNADTLLQYADMAMYQAKEGGRNHYQFFTQDMQEQVLQRLDLEQDLRLALERGELELHYQPIVESGSLIPVGCEALLRWHHPQRGLVTPNLFIPIAETTGLIGPIGEWVLQTACRQLAQWHAFPQLQGLHLSINISRRQRDSGLNGDYLGRLLRETGVPGEAVNLEITESLLMEDTRESIAWLNELKHQGIRISVDDFGTGYSSLSYLKRFPVDVIKIDRAFIRDLPDDKDDILLVETIIAMARSLGHVLVAEGVETRAQQEVLNRLGCHCQQG